MTRRSLAAKRGKTPNKGEFVGKGNKVEVAAETKLPVGAANADFTSLKQSESQGAIKIVRPSKLDAEGITGVVAEGIYEKWEANKFNAAKKDYFVRGADNTLYILNDTSSLGEQMEQLKGLEGSAVVRVIYHGKKATKSGRGFHDFEVLLSRNG